MISIREAQQVHTILIDTFGGAQAVRDISALESPLKRPFQTFDSKELYPTAIDKAAALAESILNNHLLLMEIKEQRICFNKTSFVAKRTRHSRYSTRQI